MDKTQQQLPRLIEAIELLIAQLQIDSARRDLITEDQPVPYDGKLAIKPLQERVMPAQVINMPRGSIEKSAIRMMIAFAIGTACVKTFTALPAPVQESAQEQLCQWLEQAPLNPLARWCSPPVPGQP